MKTLTHFRNALAVMLGLAIAMPSMAQEAESPQKVMKINIVKEENGERTEINEEVPLEEGADVDAILKEMGVEMGELDSGEKMQINIRKVVVDGEDVDVDVEVFADEEGEYKVKPFLGVMLAVPEEGQPAGARITEIIEDTEASKTELQAGDVITALDGKPVGSYQAAVEMIQSYKAGDQVEITYDRAGTANTTSAKLGERKQYAKTVWVDEFSGGKEMDFDFDFGKCKPHCAPQANVFRFHDTGSNKAFLGVTPGSNEGVEQGVRIGSVVENSAASEMGLQDGDIILKINGESVNDFGGLAESLGKFEAGDEVNIDYLRDGTAGSASGNLKANEERQQRFEINIDEDNARNFRFDWAPEANEELAKKAFLGVSPASSCCSKPENESSEDVAGVKIGKVTAGSTAEAMGLQAGDVITKMNGNKVESWDDLVEAIQSEEAGNEMKINYVRDGKKEKASGELKSKADFMTCAPKGEQNMVFMFDDENMKMEFNGEEMDIHQMVEQAMKEAAANGEISQEQLDEVMREMESAQQQISREVRIMISVEDATADDVVEINKSASEPIVVDNTLEVQDLTVYPNPNRGQINLQFELPEQGNVEVAVYDESGNRVFFEGLTNFTGEYNNQIDISDRAQGTYIMKVTQNGKSFTKKIIKQ